MAVKTLSVALIVHKFVKVFPVNSLCGNVFIYWPAHQFSQSTFVPVRVLAARAAQLATILRCPVSIFPQTYLGLPLLDHKLPASALEFLATKVAYQIPELCSSPLAIAVLSAIPILDILVLPFPKGVIAKMDKPRRAMLWKAAATCSDGDYQVAWDYVCRLRAEGGSVGSILTSKTHA